MSGGDSNDAAPATAAIYRWQHGRLELLDYCDPAESTLEVADSWLVSQGSVLALELHRSRFLASVAARGFDPAPVEEVWDAAVAAISRSGDWFPRVELRSHEGAPQYLFRLRNAPSRNRSIVLASFQGEDPRTAPTIKGPDLSAMLRLRTEAQQRGADDAVLLSPHGFVIEGAHAGLLWWRGEILCAPALDLERVDSVTAKSILTLATALGTEVYYESVTAAELDGVELWAVNALHGIRIVTSWIDGPSMAEQPGRLSRWRTLLDRLRQPLPAMTEAAPE
jgi:branched-subunit amino acid aminotransferase/4-amino-4-deoxychorismate lyase